MTQQWGPTLPISQQLHAKKYRTENETFYDAICRIAANLSDGEEHRLALKEILLDMRFLPAGRVQASIGAARQVTPYNCFVSGTIFDSMSSIMLRLSQATETMRLGGGIGYDFSTLRPEGAYITTLDACSSGPLSFADIFDAACKAVASAGNRRGAQMLTMRIDHPDIEKFIHAKRDLSRFKNFNLSVAVTDEFMGALESGAESFDLKFNGRRYGSVNPANLWDEIMRATYDYAEPGVLFIDTINNMNNLSYCEDIAATNPCGEQPLPPFGACLLGSFNMVKYLRWNDYDVVFNYDQFEKDIVVIIRAMDNIIDQAIYPLPEQEAEAKNKRRMGIGITGLANALETMGQPYGSKLFIITEAKILEILRDFSYGTSVELSKEKGAFPLFSADKYCNSPFIQSLPLALIESIKEHGIRNSHLTSIAPTGTISLTADNISSGIEPVFSYTTERTIIGDNGSEIHVLEDYAYAKYGVKGEQADTVPAADHLKVALVAQEYMDSAVSKTCNVGDDVTWDEFKNLYTDAWKGGAKGLTTFRASGKRYGILNKVEESDDGSACYINPETGTRTCDE